MTLDDADLSQTQVDEKLLTALELQELESATGMLYVRVHEGIGLRGMDRDGTSDPYCVTMVNGEKVGAGWAKSDALLIAATMDSQPGLDPYRPFPRPTCPTTSIPCGKRSMTTPLRSRPKTRCAGVEILTPRPLW